MNIMCSYEEKRGGIKEEVKGTVNYSKKGIRLQFT